MELKNGPDDHRATRTALQPAVCSCHLLSAARPEPGAEASIPPSAFRACATCLSDWPVTSPFAFMLFRSHHFPPLAVTYVWYQKSRLCFSCSKCPLSMDIATSLFSVLREMVDRAAPKKNCIYLGLSLTQTWRTLCHGDLFLLPVENLLVGQSLLNSFKSTNYW